MLQNIKAVLTTRLSSDHRLSNFEVSDGTDHILQWWAMGMLAKLVSRGASPLAIRVWMRSSSNSCSVFRNEFQTRKVEDCKFKKQIKFHTQLNVQFVIQLNSRSCLVTDSPAHICTLSPLGNTYMSGWLMGSPRSPGKHVGSSGNSKSCRNNYWRDIRLRINNTTLKQRDQNYMQNR